MALIATQADYEGGEGVAWYFDPAKAVGELDYRDGPHFNSRVGFLQGRVSSGKILIAGCGYGYLVKRFVALGLDAWGCDASDWCVTQGSSVAPGRIVKADITNRTQLASVLTAAGLRSNQRFAAIVTEDVLTCLTDAEITAALTELRRISSVLFHIVTAVEVEAQRNPAFNWKTPLEWKQVVGTELIMGLESATIL